MIGKILGERYELIENIGEGGMAIVYKAKDKKLNRLVAVKVLKKEFSDNKDIAEKFKREATAIANLSDTNIVNVLDVGHEEESNTDYFVMEYVSGKTLKDLIVAQGRLSYNTAISIAIQIAKALDCAHRNNIIHRDIKPQNILVTENCDVKVTDFGIAKSSTASTITNTTTIMGSAHYLSPEQAKGTFIDGRSDIYSLGIVLYEMVTGSLPFDGESPVTIALKHIQEEPVPPKDINLSIPDSLNSLILKLIAKDPNDRYTNVKELMVDLQKIKENPNAIITGKAGVYDSKTIVMSPITEKQVNAVKTQNAAKKVVNSSIIEDYDDYDDEDYEDDEVEIKSPRKNKETKISKDSKKMEKRKNKKPIIIGIILIALLLIAIPSIMMFTAGGTKEVVIPNIVGMTKEDAEKSLKSLGLTLEVSSMEASDQYKEGYIIRSTPSVGTTVKSKSKVKVVVSTGAEKIKLPDLRDKYSEYAKDALIERGLVPIISYDYSDTVEEGYVISQNPEKNTEVEKGSNVSLVISLGKEVKLITVTNVIGQMEKDAISLLESQGLVVLTTTVDTDDAQLNGIVLDQSIYGRDVKVGTEVTLTIGKYTEPSEYNVSDYVAIGDSLSDAIAALEQAGLSYTIEGATSNDYSNYIITGYTQTVKKNETVKLKVKKNSGTDSPTQGGTTTDSDETTGGSGDDSETSGSDIDNPISESQEIVTLPPPPGSIDR